MIKTIFNNYLNVFIYSSTFKINYYHTHIYIYIVLLYYNIVLQLTVAVGWFLSLFSLAYLVYGLHVVHLDLAGSALYASVGHSAWGAALAWIVIACCTGHGGCVNSALSCRLLQPLSRLTYCAYLVHPIIMTMTNFQMDGPLHLHNLITVSTSRAYNLLQHINYSVI